MSAAQYLAGRLRRAFRFFHEHAGYVVGERAVCAMRLARAEARAEAMGLRVQWEDERDDWWGDCPRPPIHVWAMVTAPGDQHDCLASLGSIGLLSWHDTYVRVVEAELFEEALAVLDERADARATAQAAEMALRPTLAGPVAA